MSECGRCKGSGQVEAPSGGRRAPFITMPCPECLFADTAAALNRSGALTLGVSADITAALDATGIPNGTPAERIERLASDRDSYMLAQADAVAEVDRLRAQCCGCPLSLTPEGRAAVAEVESLIDADRYDEAEAKIAEAAQLVPEGHPDIAGLTTMLQLGRALAGPAPECSRCAELLAEVEQLRNELWRLRSTLECPGCGDVGAIGDKHNLFTDGQELVCGCKGWVSVDAESPAEIVLEDGVEND